MLPFTIIVGLVVTIARIICCYKKPPKEEVILMRPLNKGAMNER